MNVRGQQVAVIGAKRSGKAASALLVRQGASVRVLDAETPAEGERAEFEAQGIRILPEEEPSLGGVERIVLSPGVPLQLPLVANAQARGIPVIGEVELASYFLEGPVIGITGSNGKTTTTALIGHILSESGISCQVGGNIGTAVTSLVESSAEGRWNVLELSSFQLETIVLFRADIALCLNVTPDHLDRHGTLEHYADAKARLFETQRRADLAVLNFDDPICRSFASRTKGEVYWFSLTQPVATGVSMENDELRFNGEPFLHRSGISLRGLHNVENVMAAAAAAKLAGASLDAIGAAVQSFRGVEHRIEFVRQLRGVDYFNDSKATNVDATLKAIAAFAGPLWIILGGKDKGSDYTVLREPLRGKAATALLIGEPPPYPAAAAPLIEEALTGAVPTVRCGTLERAVEHAANHASAGDTVLLAPACASFDQFENYEKRGAAFKHFVRSLF